MRVKANTTFGNAWMHRCLVALLRRIDVRVFYAFAAVFVVPVCLVLNDSRRTAYRYFRRRQGYGRRRALWATYRNHCLFSQTVIDRFALFAGRRYDVAVEGYSHFARLSAAPEAFVQLSAHVGCYEVAGYTLVADRKPLNALVYGGEKQSVMEGRQQRFARTGVTMIPVQPDMSHLFAVNEALARHETVSMPADRIVGSRKTLTVSLLGAPARLPMGPFAVATMRSLEAISVHVMKTSAKGYTAYVSPLPYDHTAPRQQQMQQLADAYAAALERLLRQYPEQWYNFFEFWNNDDRP